MTYYGYESDERVLVVSGEHLDALLAIYGYAAVQEQNRRIMRELERLCKGDLT